MRSYGLRAGAGGSRLAEIRPVGQRAKPMPAKASGGLETDLQLMLVHGPPHHIHFQPSLAARVGAQADHHQRAILQLETELAQVRPHVGAAHAPTPERVERGGYPPEVVQRYLCHVSRRCAARPSPGGEGVNVALAEARRKGAAAPPRSTPIV